MFYALQKCNAKYIIIKSKIIYINLRFTVNGKIMEDGKKRKSILEELDSKLTEEELEDFEHYTQYTQRYENMPDNQFSHAWSLINIRQGDAKNFDDLLNPHLFLGAIDDVKSLRFYQQDMFWLTNMFNKVPRNHITSLCRVETGRL